MLLKLLANGLSSFPIKGNPDFSNGPKGLPKNPPDCPILCNWVLNNFILAEEVFAKALRSSLESPKTFDEIPEILDFNLLSCELDNFNV